MNLLSRVLFIFMLGTNLISACRSQDAPVASETVPGQPPAVTDETSGGYLWISLKYFTAWGDETTDFSILPYDPATYPTAGPVNLQQAGGLNIQPHVRFRDKAGKTVADVPLRLVTYWDAQAIDGGLAIEWEAFVPDFPEYACLQLISEPALSIATLKIVPHLHLCAAE